jgi:hypothetical protein
MSDNQKVYVITKRHHNVRKGIIANQIYTEPFINSRGEVNNAVLAYAANHICEMKKINIIQPVDEYEYMVEMTEVELKDLKGVCSMMKLPLTVVVSSYCDLKDKNVTNELYYYQGREDDEYINELRKLMS